MIDSLRGKVTAVRDDSVVVDISGFGILVYVTKSLISSVYAGDEISCYAYMQISDAGISMFGFSTERERDLFLELLQVKTVGGKLAITVLRHNDIDLIIQAIMSGSPAMISAPGLGAKRAERICFELKNKIAKKFSDFGQSGGSFGTNNGFDASVLDALMGLGFSHAESARAISLTKSQSEPDREWTEETLLMAALGTLQRKQR